MFLTFEMPPEMGDRVTEYDEVLKLIDAVYEAALDEKLWAPVLMKIADAAGAADAALGVLDTNSLPFSVAPRTNPEFQISYVLNYHPINLFWHLLQPERVGQVFTEEMLLSRSQLEKSQFFNEWSTPQGYKVVMGVTLGLTETQRFELQLLSSRPYEADKLKLTQIMSPHVARAARLTSMVSAFYAGASELLSAFDRAGKATLLLDDKGRVLLASPTAEQILDEGSGLSIQQGLLVAADTTGDYELRRLLGSARSEPPGGTALIPRPSKSPLNILAAPISAKEPWGPSSSRLLLVVTDPVANMAQRNARFGRYYGLTSAELGIAVEISNGGSRSEIARRRGISDATARSHITSIFDKTGVRRQVDLLRLLHEFV